MRSLRPFVMCSFAAALTLASSLAFAAGKKDKDVEKLITSAIDDDYLALEHEKGLEKTKKALDICKKAADNCSPEVVGKIHIVSATIKAVGLSKFDDAKADLVLALKADPNAKLIDGLNPAELEAKFKEAQTEAGGGTGGAGGDGGAGGEAGQGGDGGKGGKEPGPTPSGDFDHAPIAESAVDTPLPIFAEIPDDLGATKAIVRYKPHGGTKWESLALTKMDGGFGGEIPCDAVTTTGKLRYHLVGTDETGTPVALAGSAKAPFTITIVNKLKGDAPSLPGKSAPKKCQTACPPGMPGCGGTADGKVEGVICDATAECMAGLACLSGVCTPDGSSTPGETTGTQHVISLGAQFDLAYVSDGENVCSASNAGSYICMEQNTDPARQFVGNPGEVNGTNGISGGLAFGGARILAGYDYFFGFGLGLGARLGFAFGGPSVDDAQVVPDGSEYGGLGKSFFPAHIEARASWKFLAPNPNAGDFAPHVFIGGGGAQVNASVPVKVCDGLEEPGDNEACPGETDVDAYQLSGLTFITFGGGATYMFIQNFGLSADLKFMVLFPTVGFTISPTISPVVAF